MKRDLTETEEHWHGKLMDIVNKRTAKGSDETTNLTPEQAAKVKETRELADKFAALARKTAP